MPGRVRHKQVNVTQPARMHADASAEKLRQNHAGTRISDAPRPCSPSNGRWMLRTLERCGHPPLGRNPDIVDKIK